MTPFKIVTAMLLGITIASATAQKTTRSGLKAKSIAASQKSRVKTDTAVLDSTNRQAVAFSGYEKALRSTSETVFLTNRSNDTICGMKFAVKYFDMAGHSLHTREITNLDLVPPGETRQLTFKSWDPHKVFHYYLTTPGRASGNATPYTVTIIPLWMETYANDK